MMKSIKRIAIILLLTGVYISGRTQATQAWSPVGSIGANHSVHVLKTIGSDLYATLFHYEITKDTSFHIAKWNGLFWTHYPSIKGYGGNILYCDILDDTLYIAYKSDFGAKRLTVNKFINGSWVDVPIPMINTISSNGILTTLNNELYLHGDIRDTTNASISIIKYKNGVWSNVGPGFKPGISGKVESIYWFNNNLLLAGPGFKTANSNSLVSKNIIWDGTNWQKFNNGIDSASVLYLESDTLFCIKDSIGTTGKGLFKSFSNNFTPINYNAKINGICSSFVAIKGVYFADINFSTGAGFYRMKDNFWKQIDPDTLNPRILMANYKDELHAAANYRSRVEKLNSALCYIMGNIYKDLNNDCFKNASDINIKIQRKVTLQPDNRTTFTDENGDFIFLTVPGTKTVTNTNLFNTRFLVPSSCSSNSKTVTTVSDGVSWVSFPLKDSANVTNLSVNVFAGGGHRIRKAGNDRVEVKVINSGTTTVTSGTVSIVLDPLLSIVSSSPAYASFVNNTVTWSLANIAPESILTFELKVSLSVSAVMGDSIKYVTKVKPHPDADTTDSKDSVKCVIVSSYDPNDKQCFPADVITKTTPHLNYTIRFQNTGTAEAINVYVVDTLDTNLPMDKVEITGWSTPVRPKIEVKDGKVLVFTFANIMLPDSHANEPQSHGFISYRVALTKPMQVGTIVKNRADIYFDYNKPVLTNTTENICVDNIGINDTKRNNIIVPVYPNPANDKLIIDFKNVTRSAKESSVKICDLNGKLVLEKQIESGNTEMILDIKTLVSGFYILGIYDNNELISAQKISVMK